MCEKTAVCTGKARLGERKDKKDIGVLAITEPADGR